MPQFQRRSQYKSPKKRHVCRFQLHLIQRHMVVAEFRSSIPNTQLQNLYSRPMRSRHDRNQARRHDFITTNVQTSILSSTVSMLSTSTHIKSKPTASQAQYEQEQTYATGPASPLHPCRLGAVPQTSLPTNSPVDPSSSPAPHQLPAPTATAWAYSPS